MTDRAASVTHYVHCITCIYMYVHVHTYMYMPVGLCSWVINIVKFYRVYCDVEPKRRALAAANAELEAARNKLNKIKAKIKVHVCIISTCTCTCIYMYRESNE